jgi:hypothetical protein
MVWIVWKFLSSSLLFWEISGFFCTVVVIAGCVGEYIAEFTDILRGQIAKQKLARLSLIILTAGIAGELLTGIQSSIISGSVIANLGTSVRDARQSADGALADLQAANKRMSEIGQKTRDAAVSAREANDAERELEARATQLGNQLDASEKRLAWLSPRDTLIIERQKEFKKFLSQFKGQKVSVTVCGGQFLPRGDQELMLAASGIRIALRDAAQWQVEGFSFPAITTPLVDQSCPIIGEGASVFIREDSPATERKAAVFLEAILDDVLSQSIPVSNLPIRWFSVNGQPYPSDTIKVEVRMHPMRPTGPSRDDLKLLGIKH